MFDNHTLKKWMPIVILLAMATLIIYSLAAVLTVFLGAIIFYVLTRPVMKLLTEKWKFRKGLAALLIIFLTFALILGPLILVSNVLYVKLNSLFMNTSFHESFLKANVELENWIGIKIFSKENIQSVQREATSFLTNIVSQTFNAVGSIAIMYFVLYYMLINYGKAELFLSEHLPLSSKNIDELNHELKVQVYSNAIGSPLMAFIQCVVAIICYYYFKVNDPIFWGVISGVFSMIPFIGSALIWFPIGVMMIVNGNQFDGIAILLTGILIISTIDNLLRFILQKKIANVHPLITLFGLIGGVKLFGLPGIIFGPLLLSYFFILLRMYRKHLRMKVL